LAEHQGFRGCSTARIRDFFIGHFQPPIKTRLRASLAFVPWDSTLFPAHPDIAV
jgi:hypothetical protein